MINSTTLRNADSRISELARRHSEDPENASIAQAYESALRRAGRDDEADKIVIPTVIREGRNAREYVLGSNGKKPKRSRFTVVNVAAGQRITFCTQRERLSEDRDYDAETDERDDRYWKIGAMVGTDNDSSYQNFGIIRLEGGFPKFYWASQSRIAKDDKTVKVFAWLWKSLAQGILPQGIEFHNEGRCSRCRRVLTVPESRERGIGPVCFGRYHSSQRPVQPSQGNCGHEHDHNDAQAA